MQIRVGLENGIEGRSLAWALDYPGCFAYGRDGTEALLHLPAALVRYKSWVDSCTPDSWMADLQDFDIRLEEVFECYTIDENFSLTKEGYEVNAWFRDDWRPLHPLEIERGLKLLAWSRQALVELISAIPPQTLDQDHAGERWTIHGIVRHIAKAEHWYLSRFQLEAVPWEDLPEELDTQLSLVRNRVNEVLPEMAFLQKVVGVEGEFWSPRKLLRRLLWHEKDHIEHIQKLWSLSGE